MRAAVALLLLAAPFALAAPVPKALKAKLKDYYPLAEGTTWEYKVGQEECVVRATEVTHMDGVTTSKLVTEHNGKQVATETIRVDKEGVFRTHINEAEVRPPVPLLKFGLTDEDGWEVKSKVLASDVTGKTTLKGTEKVKVPAGEFDAVLVVGEWDLAGTETATRWWLADGVGVVKLEVRVSGTLHTQSELKKYTPGKAK
jgi:hypothetical protein